MLSVDYNIGREMRDWQRAGDRCSTQCILYSVYAVLSVNSWSWNGEIEWDDLTSCVELRTRKRQMRGDGGNHYEKLGRERIWCVSQFTIPDTDGTSAKPAGHNTSMRSSKPNQASCTPDSTHPLVSYIVVSTSSPISLYLLYSSTIIAEHKVKSPLLISPFCDHELTLGTALHRVQHAPSAAYTLYSIHQGNHEPHTAYN